MAKKKIGVLLINLGTPDNCDVKSVRNYLKEFLNDPYVIDLPYLVRQILLRAIILPTRPKQSAHAYQKIWTDQGSPLLINSQDLSQGLATSLGEDFQVVLAMRYGNPSIQDSLQKFSDIDQLIVIPLYPQYSTACTFSSIDKFKKVNSLNLEPQNIKFIESFFDDAGFIEAQANLINPFLSQAEKPFLLLSYHGLPERHLIKEGCKQICDGPCDFKNDYPATCYRKQCYQTSRLLAKHLKLDEQNYMSSFQSRLGKTPWIRPYTDKTFDVLIKRGIKDIAVACPSFVSDCLETLEEIGMQGREDWQALGGNSFTLIPCLNSQDDWVAALANLVKSKIA